MESMLFCWTQRKKVGAYELTWFAYRGRSRKIEEWKYFSACEKNKWNKMRISVSVWMRFHISLISFLSLHSQHSIRAYLIHSQQFFFSPVVFCLFYKSRIQYPHCLQTTRYDHDCTLLSLSLLVASCTISCEQRERKTAKKKHRMEDRNSRPSIRWWDIWSDETWERWFWSDEHGEEKKSIWRTE